MHLNIVKLTQGRAGGKWRKLEPSCLNANSLFMESAMSMANKKQIFIEVKSTPLREFILDNIPVRYWSLFKNVNLHTQLGFQSALRYPNLHMLLRCLG